jgi:heptosyltransferase III
MRQARNRTLKILVVRSDRLGDVILSTPVFEVLKRHYPRSHLTVMVRESVSPLLEGLKSVDAVMHYEPEGRHRGISGFFKLMTELREQEFRIAVVLQSQFRIAAALFGAGVRYRVGPLSKVHSFLFYNRGVRQRRSQVEMHEADYNLQLLRRLGIRVGTRNIPTRIALRAEARDWARQWLESNGWQESQSLIIVHPGMGGSALNWPESHYIEFIRALSMAGCSVLVTGGAEEVLLLERVQQGLGDSSGKTIFYGGGDAGAVDRLAGLMSWANLVVAPSTGPLHIAVALEKPVISFYPPIRVQSAIRWGPYAPDGKNTSVLVPEVYCGQDFDCRGSLCNYYPCMKSLTVTQALEEAHRQLAQIGGPRNG